MNEPGRSWLHDLLRAIDDDLVELGAVQAVVARVGPEAERRETLAVLHALSAADWLRDGHLPLWSRARALERGSFRGGGADRA